MKNKEIFKECQYVKTIKLPADLRDWKVTSFVGEDNGCEVYKVSRKIDKNTAQNAILRHAFVGKSNYTDEHAEYFTEEADFIESVKELDGISNYLDVYVQDNQNKKPVICTYLQKNSQVLKSL